MRILSCLPLLFGIAAGYSESQINLKERETGAPIATAHAVLREASELALKQGKHEHFWTDRTLLEIGDLQIRTGDFDGALRSLRGSNYPFGRDIGLVRLIEALARDGKKDRALDICRLMVLEGSRDQQYLHEVVQIHWADHLIAKGDFQQAAKIIEKFKSPQDRHEALRKLAIAYGKFGDAALSANHFAAAIDAATGIEDESNRAKALWETAEAQRAGGSTDAAQATLHQLVAKSDSFKDPWVRMTALRECALLSAKLKDFETARRLLDRAVKVYLAADKPNSLAALQNIASAQASVGFIDDARKTASMIEHDKRDFTRDSYREGVLCAIADTQLKAGDVGGAIATALSVKRFVQFRDDVLSSIVAYQINKRDWKAAVATTALFDNSSRKATAVLKVATAMAKSGERKAAISFASQIKLTHESEFRKMFNSALKEEDRGFEYLRPQTWGENYDASDFFTMASHRASVQRTAEVAASALEFAQTLQYQPAQSYAILFNDFYGDVVQTLARTHVMFGNSSEAVAWAKQIGSGDIIPEKDTGDVRWAVERRIHALLGVAEGLLERSGK